MRSTYRTAGHRNTGHRTAGHRNIGLKVALLTAALLLPLSACQEKRADAPPPPPVAITADAIGHYCGMTLLEHPGPKGEVLVEGRAEPVWLSSVRDTFAFTMLPEETKDVRAIYVTDMGKSSDPRKPDLSVWVEARKAWYVLGSDQRGGMGAAEPFPFAEEAAARTFAEQYGGTVKRFADVREDEILTTESAAQPASDDMGAMPGMTMPDHVPSDHAASGHGMPENGARP